MTQFACNSGQALVRWLPRRRVRMIAVGVIAVALGLLVLSVLTSHHGRSRFGTPLGGDFPCFYAAGTILNQYGPQRLYDLPLQARLYHVMLPGEAPEASLPFAYPPYLAVVFRPLAMLPYAVAFAVWTGISISIYAAGLVLLWRMCDAIPKADRWIAVLLAGAFEPFIVECVHGGQLSAIAMFWVCLGMMLDRRGRRLWAGMALGMLAYKPTLLVMIVPMLLVGGRWRTLLGMGVSSVGLGVVSLALVGVHACQDYVRLLLNYGHSSAGGEMIFRTWKFVDINAFIRLLVGHPSPVAMTIVAAVIVGGMVVIGRMWWHINPRQQVMAWAAAIAGTLVFNLYVGIYDVVLIVPAMWMMADWLYRREGKLPMGFLGLMGVMYGMPWMSQGIAMGGGVQLLTVVLGGVVGYAIIGGREGLTHQGDAAGGMYGASLVTERTGSPAVPVAEWAVSRTF